MSTKRLLLIATVVLAATGTAWGGGVTAERSFWIGQWAHGPTGDDVFSTTVNFLNLSTTVSTITVRTFDNDGDPLSLLRGITPPFDAVNERTVILAGRGTGTLLSDSNETGLLIGYAQASTANAVAVEVVFSLRDADGNVITATNVRTPPLVTALSFLGRNNAGAKTGMAVLLPPGSDGPVDVDFTFYNSDGTIRATESLPLQVGQKVSRFLDELVSGLSNFTGSVEVRS